MNFQYYPDRLSMLMRFKKKEWKYFSESLSGNSMHEVADVPWMFKERGWRILCQWARSLKYFRFVRCDNNPRNVSSDHFSCKLRYENESNMHRLLNTLNVHLERGAAPEDVHHLRRHPNFPLYFVPRPSWSQVFDVRFNLLFLRNFRVKITVFDSEKPYTVTAKDFEGAKRIEAVLHPFASWIIDPPQDNWLCLCPKYWPEVFSR